MSEFTFFGDKMVLLETTSVSKTTLYYLNSALIKRFAVVCVVRKLSKAVYLVRLELALSVSHNALWKLAYNIRFLAMISDRAYL